MNNLIKFIYIMMMNKIISTFKQLKFNPNFIENITKFIISVSVEKKDNKGYINLILNSKIDLYLVNEIYNFNKLNNGVELCYKFNDLYDFEKAISYFCEWINNTKIKYDFIGLEFLLQNKILIIKHISNSNVQTYNQYKNDLFLFFSDFLKVDIIDIEFVFDQERYMQTIKDISDYDKQIHETGILLFKQNNEEEQIDNNEITKISDLNELGKFYNISGTIFKIEKSKLKTGSNLIIAYINDDSGALMLKKFYKANDSIFSELKENDLVTIKIKLDKDAYSHNSELLGIIFDIKILEKSKTIIDEAVKKHIEFCLHSKMSAYDSTINLEELSDFIKTNNIEYLGISDRYNVQIYPDIEKQFKKNNTKIIYGVEFEVLDKKIPTIINPKKINFNEIPTVVFDLETSGLNANFDDIIEFGAVKMYPDGNFEKIDFFIKPKKPISEFTTNLTNITNEMLNESGLNIEEGIKKIYAFCKDAVLIAHNGYNFDFNFINTKFIELGLKPLDNIMIDTLNVSRSINAILSHKLEKVAKKYKIEYDPDIAHRADYDADVLYNIWIKMLDEFKSLDINNYYDLYEYLNSKTHIYKDLRGTYINVYAKNQNGIKRIYELVSLSHTKNLYNRPILFWEDIDSNRKDIIIANNPIESDLNNLLLNNPFNQLDEAVKKYDFILVPTINHYLHLIDQGLDISNVKFMIKTLIDYSIKNKKLFNASSNCYYILKEHKKFYDLLTKIWTLNKKPHRFRYYKNLPNFHYHSTTELFDLYDFITDKEILNKLVIENGYTIISAIDFDIKIIKEGLYAPIIDGVNEKLKDKVYKTAYETYGNNLPDIVKKQIDKELESIISHNFSVVYWISHLLVKKSNDDGYLVGSRGSVGSSIVATFLKITDVNPLPPHYLCTKCKYSNFNVKDVYNGFDLKPINCPNCNELMYGQGHNIPFETFLGFKGDKVPDIDLNFSGIYQPNAHNFIKEMFGESHAFRAGTISTIAEKTSFTLAKEYFTFLNKNVNNATLALYAKYCVDVKRTTGQHPGGIVVVPKHMDILDFTPYNYPADDNEESWFTTHFQYEYIHDNLLKFDILGHDNPTILRMLEDLTGVKYDDIPNYDEKTIKLFTDISILGIDSKDFFDESTGAVSLPEFGTTFVREMLKNAHPTTFDDLIRISGLSHGTDVWLGNAFDLIKSGKTLKDVIACRDDIMNYLIANNIEPIIAFSIMEDVRKGKKIKPEHIKILKEFNIPEWYIESANKIKYMFPKAHATAYVLHAWKFAWYKINKPLEYYASYLSVRQNTFDIIIATSDIEKMKSSLSRLKELSKSKTNSLTKKDQDWLSILEVIYEAKLRGINFLKVDINKSEVSNFIIDKTNNTILCPLITIDGLGENVAISIVEARNQKPFSSLPDFLERTKVNKKIIEELNKINALDHLNDSNQISLFD